MEVTITDPGGPLTTSRTRGARSQTAIRVQQRRRTANEFKEQREKIKQARDRRGRFVSEGTPLDRVKSIVEAPDVSTKIGKSTAVQESTLDAIKRMTRAVVGGQEVANKLSRTQLGDNRREMMRNQVSSRQQLEALRDSSDHQTNSTDSVAGGALSSVLGGAGMGGLAGAVGVLGIQFVKRLLWNLLKKGALRAGTGTKVVTEAIKAFVKRMSTSLMRVLNPRTAMTMARTMGRSLLGQVTRILPMLGEWAMVGVRFAFRQGLRVLGGFLLDGIIAAGGAVVGAVGAVPLAIIAGIVGIAALVWSYLLPESWKDAVKEKVGDLLNGIWTGMKNIGHYVAKGAGIFAEAGKTAITTVWDTAASAVKTSMDFLGITAAATWMGEAAAGWWNGTVSTAYERVKSTVGSWFETGWNFLKGMGGDAVNTMGGHLGYNPGMQGNLTGPGVDGTAGAGATAEASKAVSMLSQMGWKPHQAAGIVGNFQQEAGANLNHKAVGDNGQAYGIGQWHPDRQLEFKKWAKKDIRKSTLEEQVGFANYELTQGKERAAGNIIRQTQNAAQAAAATSDYYERPDKTDQMGRVARQNNAIRLMGGTTNAASVGVASTGAMFPSASPRSIVDVGRELSQQGMRISENGAFGGVTPGAHQGRGHAEQRAIDVNFGKGVNEARTPQARMQFDQKALEYSRQGFNVLWNGKRYGADGKVTPIKPGDNQHTDHMHIEQPSGSPVVTAGPAGADGSPGAAMGEAGSEKMSLRQTLGFAAALMEQRRNQRKTPTGSAGSTRPNAQGTSGASEMPMAAGTISATSLPDGTAITPRVKTSEPKIPESPRYTPEETRSKKSTAATQGRGGRQGASPLNVDNIYQTVEDLGMLPLLTEGSITHK